MARLWPWWVAFCSLEAPNTFFLGNKWLLLNAWLTFPKRLEWSIPSLVHSSGVWMRLGWEYCVVLARRNQGRLSQLRNVCIHAAQCQPHQAQTSLSLMAIRAPNLVKKKSNSGTITVLPTMSTTGWHKSYRKCLSDTIILQAIIFPFLTPRFHSWAISISLMLPWLLHSLSRVWPRSGCLAVNPSG